MPITTDPAPTQPAAPQHPAPGALPRRRWLQGALGAAMLAPAHARAAWPERPVEIIVPFPPGGGVDITARIAARFLEKHLPNRGFVVMNRPGAGGEIGWGAVADARPDGYMLGLLNAPNILALPIERQTPRFRADSFDLIANLADDPVTISVHASSPIRSIADFVAATRARTGADRMTYGTAGIGAVGHIAMLSLERAAGISTDHIPFQGASQVAAALLGRQIDFGTTTFAESVSFARNGGEWRVLGVMAPERLTAMPEVPTFKEAGIAVEIGSQRGLGGPRGMPPAVRATLTEALDRIVADPEFLTTMAQASLPVRYMKREAYAAHLARLDGDLRSLWQSNPWRQQ